VNVGTGRKVPMAELRGLLGELGHTDVATYVQSGNVVFTGGGTAAAVASALEAAIAERFGLDVRVLLRTRAQLAAVVKGNPFHDDPKTLHVMFLEATPRAAAVKAIDPEPFRPDEFAVKGREIYLHLPNGMGRTKINNAFFERKLALAGTGRNWRTVTTLLDML
jgi:uncharacterized protein (DUF1697 family)